MYKRLIFFLFLVMLAFLNLGVIASYAATTHFLGYVCTESEACSTLQAQGDMRACSVTTTCASYAEYYPPDADPSAPTYKCLTAFTQSYSDVWCIYYVDVPDQPTANYCAPSDTDGDGLDDDVDPFPDDPGEFTYIKVGEYVDGNGNVTAVFYKCINSSTGEVKYVTIGTPGANDTFYAIVVGESWKGSDEYSAMLGNDPGDVEIDNTLADTDTGIDSSINGSLFDDVDHQDDFNQGNDSTGNTTDTEHLADIVDNTKTMVDNQKVQGQILEEISDKIGALGTISMGSQTTPIQVAGDGTGEGATAEEIADEIIGDGTGTDLNIDNSGVDTAQQGATDAFNTTNDILTDAPLEYQTKTDLDAKIQEIEDNTTVQSIKDIFTDSQVTTVGTPCMDYVYKGKTIQFCVDRWDSQLTAWGVLMLSMVSLHALLIVFRRR